MWTPAFPLFESQRNQWVITYSHQTSWDNSPLPNRKNKIYEQHLPFPLPLVTPGTNASEPTTNYSTTTTVKPAKPGLSLGNRAGPIMRPKTSPSLGVNRAGKQSTNDNKILINYDSLTKRQNISQDNKTHFVIKKSTKTPQKGKKRRRKSKIKRRTLQKYKRRDNNRKKKNVWQNT